MLYLQLQCSLEERDYPLIYLLQQKKKNVSVYMQTLSSPNGGYVNLLLIKKCDKASQFYQLILGVIYLKITLLRV